MPRIHPSVRPSAFHPVWGVSYTHANVSWKRRYYFPHSSSERTLRVNLLSAIASGSQNLATISTLHPYNPASFKWKTVCQMLVVCFIKSPCLWIHLAGSRSRMRRHHRKKQSDSQTRIEIRLELYLNNFR